MFIPMEVCALRNSKRFMMERSSEIHCKLMAVRMDHNIYWVDNLMKAYFKGFKNLPIKLVG